MYMTTAGITGVFLLAMFLVTPQNVVWGKIEAAVLALVVFLATQPIRKGLAIAIEYWVDSRLEFPKHR
jgi:drug/metabolite transporter superfamily protein YnfA